MDKLIRNVPRVGYYIVPRVEYRPAAVAATTLARSASMSSSQFLLGQNFHHYHLTLDEDGHPVWIYATLDFRGGKPGAALRAEAALLPRMDADPLQYRYVFEEEWHGQHLLLKMVKANSTKGPAALEFYPRPDSGNKECFCGARINDTFSHSHVSSITILSRSQIKGLEGHKPGPILLSDPAAQVLQKFWDEHSYIERLPDTVRQSWDDKEFDRFLDHTIEAFQGKDSSEKVINILTAFFINEEQANGMLKRLLAEGFQIKIRMLHPDNPALVFARFGARTDDEHLRYSENLLRTIQGQWTRLKMLNPTSSGGNLDLQRTDLMPYGFGMFGVHGGVIGLMPAHASFRRAGALIRVAPGTPLHDMMLQDWRARERQQVFPVGTLGDGGRDFTLGVWPEIRELLPSCRLFRMAISWFPGFDSRTEFRNGFMAALEHMQKSNDEASGMQILLSHPDCAFALYRGAAVLRNPADGPRLIKAMRSTLKNLKSPHAKLAVRLTDVPIPAPFIQLDRRIYFGMFWTTRNAVEGPWLTIDADSFLGRELSAQFDDMWEDRWSQADDLHSTEPPVLIPHMGLALNN